MKGRLIIPDNLSEVSLAQYQTFLKNSEGKEGTDLKLELVSTFCKIDRNIAKAIKLTDIEEIASTINAMFETDYPFIAKFKIDGVSFGFIPDLENMSFGEYVDLDSYLSDWSKMHKAMAVLFRPITNDYKGKYLIEDYESSEKYAEVMKLMPLSCAMGAMVFFYHLGIKLLQAIPQFLEREVETLEILVNKTNSTSSGVGITQSINSLKETFADLTKSLRLDWRQHLHI